jgi:hypothetical protein
VRAKRDPITARNHRRGPLRSTLPARSASSVTALRVSSIPCWCAARSCTSGTPRAPERRSTSRPTPTEAPTVTAPKRSARALPRDSSSARSTDALAPDAPITKHTAGPTPRPLWINTAATGMLAWGARYMGIAASTAPA